MYIHERDNWTNFYWDRERILPLQETVCRKQGLLFGRLNGLGLDSKLHAMAENVTSDVVYSSEIEGIRLNMDEVRSSVARHLGIDTLKYTAPSHYVDGVVYAMLQAMREYNHVLTKEKLCGWQTAFFPLGNSGGVPIEVGQYRSGEEHIVSGRFGREHVHYIAPAPDRVEAEMEAFLRWFNSDITDSSLIRSAIAHLWFVSIHPFEDGNGRLARILSDMMLARGDKSEFRFYNISAEINRDKSHYYDILELTQHGDGDITEWLVWYLEKINSALDEAERMISTILNKSLFWHQTASLALSRRQTDVLNIFLDGYEAKITSKTWANLGKCSKDTAIRDILDLLDKRILIEDVPGAKRPSYSIVYNREDLTQFFSDVSIIKERNIYHLTAIYQGRLPVKERILTLDAERYMRSELPLDHLLNKYCSYLTLI